MVVETKKAEQAGSKRCEQSGHCGDFRERT